MPWREETELLINDPQDIGRAEIKGEKRTNRSRSAGGQAAQWLNGEPRHCTLTDDVNERLVRFPSHNTLAIVDGERVVSAAGRFRCERYRP